MAENLMHIEVETKSKQYEDSIRVKKKYTLQDIKDTERSNPLYKKGTIKEGDEKSIFPVPENKEEAIKKFKNYDAQRGSEFLQNKFIQKYGTEVSKKIIEDELHTINDFIHSSNEYSVVEAFKGKDQSEYFEYLRLANGYYENPSLPFNIYETYFNPSQKSNSLMIYARYFLYKEWLEKLIGKEEQIIIDPNEDNPNNRRKKKNSISNPKKLALLQAIGFFDLPVMQNLSEDKQNEIVALLLDADKKEFVYKNRLNINSKNPNYQIDKYTAYQYLEEMENIINEMQ